MWVPRRAPVDSSFSRLLVRRQECFFSLLGLLLIVLPFVPEIGPKRIELATFDLVFTHQHVLKFG
ncbi:hypothetical protein GGP72_000389 [Salinibacter ruber]|jgi:hypothetical protein|uniref:Uncharacterized protein n=1 Tax=Salinibacter ruber TaxID=146919 RepID=A0A9X2PYN2_9BACT|nr:hypothetical protein [Salinibacter ruber]MCS3679780.1 hypothetical protein [Salinibacter ruber]